MDVHRAKPAKVVIRPQLQLLLRFSSPELAEKLTQKGLETSDSADATTTTPTYPQVRYIGGEIPEKFCYYASSDDEYPALLLSLPLPVICTFGGLGFSHSIGGTSSISGCFIIVCP